VASSHRRTVEKQKIRFRDIEGVRLSDILDLRDPPFVDRAEAHKQLNYIDCYVRHRDLRCKSVVVEDHYVDRDHIEDHSVFYSKNLIDYPNYCQRVHFFSLTKDELRTEMRRIRALRASAGAELYASACAKFSCTNYIGFAVIKPLAGSPVGRTVLRPLQADSGKSHTREFNCVCDFDIHLLGLRLGISGLPFQQQDLGVSACATTALWISLQRARQLEQGGAATPAQITIRASQFALPFGRPMPSEGLSLDQMSQAVQSLGYSPSVYLSNSFEVTRALLHSSISSGISPVLIIEKPGTSDRHAIAAAGVALEAQSGPVLGEQSTEVRHASEDVVGLYVHDDRYGPYLKATIAKRDEDLLIRYEFKSQPQNQKPQAEEWTLTHVLIPLHAKIRLSFGELYRAGVKLLEEEVQPYLTVKNSKAATIWSSLILRSHQYVDSILARSGMQNTVERLCSAMRLSRYLGVIHFENPGFDAFDVLLDTTSTARNLNCLGVVQLGKALPSTRELSNLIIKHYGGVLIS
jgi:hypothetical protein